MGAPVAAGFFVVMVLQQKNCTATAVSKWYVLYQREGCSQHLYCYALLLKLDIKTMLFT